MKCQFGAVFFMSLINVFNESKNTSKILNKFPPEIKQPTYRQRIPCISGSEVSTRDNACPDIPIVPAYHTPFLGTALSHF